MSGIAHSPQGSPPSPAALTPRIPGARQPNFAEQIARHKVGDPKWEVCIWQVIGDIKDRVVLMIGAEPRILTRGKRKGRKCWDHIKRREMLSTVVRDEEVNAAKTAFEESTGACGECGGGGEVWAGWNHKTGDRFRECRRCSGTGNAPPAKIEAGA